jgi:hypothetical protein
MMIIELHFLTNKIAFPKSSNIKSHIDWLKIAYQSISYPIIKKIPLPGFGNFISLIRAECSFFLQIYQKHPFC